jgi:hypothetical protein
VPERPFTDEEVDAALRALTEPDRFREAEARVARIAPQLQHVLYQALEVEGGFAQMREGEIISAARDEELAERVRRVRSLLAEETRLGMLIGVAVGWELARELEMNPTQEEDR